MGFCGGLVHWLRELDLDWTINASLLTFSRFHGSDLNTYPVTLKGQEQDQAQQDSQEYEDKTVKVFHRRSQG